MGQPSADASTSNYYPRRVERIATRRILENHVFSRDFTACSRENVTTENRGVPGSSPGLAIGVHTRAAIPLAVRAIPNASASTATIVPAFLVRKSWKRATRSAVSSGETR